MATMSEAEFAGLQATLLHDAKTTTIDINSLTHHQFETILECYHDCRGKLKFRRGIPQGRFQQILINKIISNKYHRINKDVAEDKEKIFITLAREYHVNYKNVAFDYSANVEYWDFKLQNLTYKTLFSDRANQQIANFYRDLNVNFLTAIEQNDLTKVKLYMAANIDINLRYNQQTPLTLACKLGNKKIVDQIIKHRDCNPNLANDNNDYPVTLACVNGHMEIFLLLRKRFADTIKVRHDLLQAWGEPKQDPWHISLTTDNHEFLGELLKDYQRSINQPSLESPEPNPNLLQNLQLLHTAATNISANNCLQLIVRELRILQTNMRDLTREAAVGNLRDLMAFNQSINKSDHSTIVSIIALCKKFNIRINQVNCAESATTSNVTENTVAYRTLNPYDIDIDKEFNKIKKIINRTSGDHFTITNRQTGQQNILSTTQYRQSALSMFNKIKFGIAGYNGNFATWRSNWLDSNYTGLTVKEAWALAVRAIYDRHAIAGKFLTDDDIRNREQTLVDWLVDCARAYNIDEAGNDFGGDNHPSCVHGVFVRAILALSGLHDAVQIVTHPEQWAAEIAKQALGDFFINYQNNLAVAAALRINIDHITNTQQKTIDDFYTTAKPIVKAAIMQQVGLRHAGGYLYENDVENILNNIAALSLPVINNSTEINEIYADFAQISYNPLLNKRNPSLQQIKLPESANNFYVAVMLSAADQQLDLSTLQQAGRELATVADICAVIANFIENLFKPDPPQQVTLSNSCANNNPQPTLISKQALISNIKHALNPGNPAAVQDDQIQAYVNNIRHHAYADSICRKLTAVIYNRPIRLFSYYGEEMLTITPQDFFIKINLNNQPLNLCYNRSTEIEHGFNALLQAKLWPQHKLQTTVAAITSTVNTRLNSPWRFGGQLFTNLFNLFSSTGQAIVPAVLTNAETFNHRRPKRNVSSSYSRSLSPPIARRRLG